MSHLLPLSCSPIIAALNNPFAVDPTTLALAQDGFQPAWTYAKGIERDLDTHSRIQEVQDHLKRRQAAGLVAGKCIRAFVDYVAHKSIPAKLCQAVQQIDLGYIRNALHYLSSINSMNVQAEYEAAGEVNGKLIMTSDQYAQMNLVNSEFLDQLHDCEGQVELLSGEQDLFVRNGQLAEP